ATLPPPPTSTPFPYTTLFRSQDRAEARPPHHAPSPTRAPAWARGPQTDAPGQPDARRPDRAALPRAEAQEGPARPALRRLGVDEIGRASCRESVSHGVGEG